MPARKIILAVLLATLQIAWSFSWGACEALAQTVYTPATRVQTGGVPVIPASAAGAFSSLGRTIPLSQVSLAASFVPGLQPVPSLNPALAPMPAAALAAAAPSSLSPTVARGALAVEDSALSPERRDAPAEESSRAGAESFAALYPEKLIEPRPAPLPAVPVAAGRPLRILIAGPPGAGKTTFGKMLARDYGMIHISVGELLRARAASDPALAAAMAGGELVDSDLVRGVVLERLSRPDVLAHGFILDGFPRRPEEIGVIESWMKDGGTLDALVHLNAPDAELRRRVLARGRMDDSPEVFRRRMEIYREQTKPVLDHFRAGVRVLEADAGGPDAESNYAGVRGLIERVRAER